MSERYKFNNPEGIYFVTSTIVYWIDLFTGKGYIHIIIDTLKKYQEKRNLIIHAYCIMPSHLHLIISSKNSTESLGGIMRDFKKLSNKRILEEIININESRKDWLLRAFQNSGKNNAVEAEIVEETVDYKYSSAKEYASLKRGLLDIELLC